MERLMTDRELEKPPNEGQAQKWSGGRRVVITVAGFLCGGALTFSMVALGAHSFLAVLVPPIAAQIYLVISEGKLKEFAQGVLLWGLAEIGACLVVGFT